MESRFGFLDDKFPKIAAFGRRAEEASGHDNNICLLSLGRIGESVAEILCRHNSIDYDNKASDSADELLRLGLIDEDICRKIQVLAETRDDAFTDDYSSGMACMRLLTTAQELCEWFVSTAEYSRFDFLADLYQPSRLMSPLADLACLGREAEENLYHNPRYCLICLGDIGEAVVDMLIDIRGINTHDKEQLEKINTLYFCGVISDSMKDTLHELRIARNKAVHHRYASADDGKAMLDNSLPLCEWMFRFVMSAGDVVRGSISGVNEDSVSVSIGRLSGIVPLDEIPANMDVHAACISGDKRNFRVVSKDDGEIVLSISQLHKNPWTESSRKYSRYHVGQDVNAIVRRVTEAFGAFVELRDGLKARVPETEYSIDTKKPSPRIGQHIMGRVKWLNPEEYPYMLLSIKDAESTDEEAVPDEMEDSAGTERPKPKSSKTQDRKKKARDKLFLDMCRKAPASEVSSALANGADIGATNKNGMTALMMAAMYNKDHEVIDVLIGHGAAVNAQNKMGNTALIFAAKQNTAEVVRALCNGNADVIVENNDGRRALYYARSNPRAARDAEVMELLGDETVEHEAAEMQVEAAEEAITHADEEVPYTSEDDMPDNEEPEQTISSQDVITPADEEEAYASEDDVSYTLEDDISESYASEHDTNDTSEHDVSENDMSEHDALEADTSEHDMSESEEPVYELTHEDTESYFPQDIITIDSDVPYEAEIEDSNNEPAHAQLEPPLTEEQQEESCQAIRMTLQRDILKICRSGSVEDLTQAVDAGVNLNLRNKNSASPLMFAAQSNTSEIIDILIKAGAEINAQDNSGNTALIYAASYNTDDVVNALLDAGADMETVNDAGYKALDYAQRNYRLDDTDALRRLGA